MSEHWNPTSYFTSHMRDELVQFWDQSDHDLARINRASTELSYAILKMLQYGRARHALIFGSARFKPGNPYYTLAEDLAKGLVKREVGVITGGGPGVMEAGNIAGLEACIEAGLDPARFVTGLNITLPFEQNANAALATLRQTTPGRTPPPPKGKLLNFHYFFARKYVFARFGMALFCLPGGFGTMDETFEFLTLVQTGKLALRPIVLVGNPFWNELWGPMQKLMIREGVISETDQYLVDVVDTAEEALTLYDRFYNKHTGIRYFRNHQLVVMFLKRDHGLTQEKIDATFHPFASIAEGAYLETMVDVQELSGPDFFLVGKEDILEKDNDLTVVKVQGQIWRLKNARHREVLALHGFDMHSFGTLSRFVRALSYL